MISCVIPGGEQCTLEHLVLDLNGTLATDGLLIKGLRERILLLQQQVTVHLITADTQGTAAAIATELHLQLHQLEAGSGTDQKATLVQTLGPQQVVAMGNGANDARMLQLARVGIAVIGREGLAIAALLQADIVVSDPRDGLDLLLYPKRLIATLRT